MARERIGKKQQQRDRACGALAARTLVADAARKIATTAQKTADQAPAPAQRLDDRHALVYMRNVLDQLLADGWQASTGYAAEDAP